MSPSTRAPGAFIAKEDTSNKNIRANKQQLDKRLVENWIFEMRVLPSKCYPKMKILWLEPRYHACSGNTVRFSGGF